MVSAPQIHSPRKATILSAILPGAGQIYNKKYWKAPIAWGGMAACIYFIDFNLGEFNRYKSGLIALEDDNPSTINTTGLNSAQLNVQIDFYQRWRDISVLSLAGVYVLQIIDANVDAHLFHFDVDENISLQWSPFSLTSAGVAPGLGFSLNF